MGWQVITWQVTCGASTRWDAHARTALLLSRCAVGSQTLRDVVGLASHLPVICIRIPPLPSQIFG
eukprot:5851496-Pyramimonas_sp.AAC.1